MTAARTRGLGEASADEEVAMNTRTGSLGRQWQWCLIVAALLGALAARAARAATAPLSYRASGRFGRGGFGEVCDNIRGVA
jgi:hypothetical protein